MSLNAAAEATFSVPPSVCGAPVVVVVVVAVTTARLSGVPVQPVMPVNDVSVLPV